MRPEPVLQDLSLENLETLPCCGVKNPAHRGRIVKNCWMGRQLKKGARAKVLLQAGNRQCGYIEYIPGEYAWRGVDARGYMFIHCVWTFYKDIQHRGHAKLMLDTCKDEARQSGLDGVAVVAREGPWLADPRLFLKNGFEVVDEAPPDYQLLVWKLNPAAANPSFKGGWERKLKRYSQGLTIIRAGQCPHAVKFSEEIAEAARNSYGLEPRVIELKSHRDAQNAPTPYAVFAVIYEGRLVADHQISCTRFHNIMRKLV